MILRCKEELVVGWTQRNGRLDFDQWEMWADGVRMCRAGAPDSALAPAMRLAEGSGWMAVVLSVVRVRLGAGEGEKVLGGDEVSDALAKLAAGQLSQGGRVAWVRLLFGDAPGTGARIRRWVDRKSVV